MTYTSQQLAEELHKLSREATPGDYSNQSVSTSIQGAEAQIPTPVTEFLERTEEYAEKTRDVSVGIY